MPDTLRLALRVPDDGAREALVADLADLGFDAFEEDAEHVVAYAPAPRWDDPARAAVARWLDRHRLGEEDLNEDIIPDQDWNATWEASLAPVEAGPFVIAPSWADLAPAQADRLVLRIDPKMAFGTGYHESTRLVLRLLPEAVPRGARVLDVGTGTGVLALAALRLGAAETVGVDVDPWSVANSEENAQRNGLADRFAIREGSLDVAPPGPYGLVLANIIRSVLEPMLPELARLVAPGGAVVLAGLLQSERERMLEAAAASGLALAAEATENDWWACTLREGKRGK
ncbi:MAG: 50S ribosomal protein L11 methyltransferase [Bacteroidota bacterium]